MTAPPSTPSALSSIALSVRVHADWDSAARIIDEWDQLAMRVGSEIYTAPTHARVWWKHYGRGDAAIVEVRAGDTPEGPGQLVGAVPFFIERRRTPFGPARVCRIMACDSTITVLSPAVEPSQAKEIWHTILSALEPRCDAICLGPLAGDTGVADAIDAGARSAAGCWERVWRRRIGSHSVFELPPSFDRYLSGLGKHQRKNVRRYVRRLQEERGGEVSIIRDPTGARNQFEEFVALHRSQWRAVGRAGHFDDWPGSLEYSRELNAALADQGRAMFVRVFRDSGPLAIHWGFVLGPTGFARLSARVVDQEWATFGLGRVGMTRNIEAMIHAGVSRLDSGPGEYDHKLESGATSHPLWSIWVVGAARAQQARMRFLWSASSFLNALYYRGWFLRIRPILHLAPRPLARWWTRSRP